MRIIFAVTAMLAAHEVLAQAGSIGGTIGNSDKTVSGSAEPAQPRERAAPVPRRTAPPVNAGAAQARATAWCLNEKVTGGFRCGFTSYEQCMAARSSNGDWCMQNPAGGGGRR